MLEGDTEHSTVGSRSPYSSGDLTPQDQQLQKSPESADISFDLSVEDPGQSGKRDLFRAIAQLPGLNTNYDKDYYTTTIEDWNPSYRGREAIAHHITQETKMSSRSNGIERQDEPQNSKSDPKKAGTGMDARTESQSFPDDGAPSNSACSCGKVLVRSSDLEHHAKRYQHKQFYPCSWHGCGFGGGRKYKMRSHYKTRHGLVPFKVTSPKPERENLRAEKCEPKLKSCVQKEGDEMVEVISHTIIDWKSELCTSDDDVVQASGQPPKAGIPCMAELHRYVVTAGNTEYRSADSLQSMLQDPSIEFIILVSNHNDGFVNVRSPAVEQALW